MQPKTYLEDKSPETAANTIICVIHQACYLLDRLKKQLMQRLVEEGGIRERITAQRQAHRTAQRSPRSDAHI